ncbi:MAG: threonine-phosphate decarboxylase CobD [Pseudomonadota bacterium]
MPWLTPQPARDHGGGLAAAITRFGGTPADWMDLSTGINPVPYPVPDLSGGAWTRLPDQDTSTQLTQQARAFWNVPPDADVLAAPGASALIAQVPRLFTAGNVRISSPTYNEHAAAFRFHGWHVTEAGPADAVVVVNPNNPDGRFWSEADMDAGLVVIDESFCDVAPSASLVHLAARPGVIILKSFGKFWGLAGLRLGFAIGDPKSMAALAEMLGPWPVSGPALEIGTLALQDRQWAERTRTDLQVGRAQLDSLMVRKGASVSGGTSLFGLYSVDNAESWQDRLAHHHIWTRVFPYSDTLLRLGLPANAEDRSRLEAAL